MAAFWTIIFLVVAVIFIAGGWKTFVKAGQPGWAVIIPIYNVIVMLNMVRRPVWWIVLFFIPLANIVVAVIVSMELAKAFGRSPAFGIVLLWLLAGIGFLILGFGSDTYHAPDRPAAQAFA